MDVEKFISSGILESYVLGIASPEEVREAEAAAAQHPEVSKEIAALRDALEKYADAHKTMPPDHLKSKILNEIEKLESEKINRDNGKVIPMEVPQRSGAGRWLAAAILLLLGSVIMNVVQYNKLHEAKDRIAALESEKTALAEEFNSLKANFIQNKSELALISSPLTKTILMKGVPQHPDALASIYWDTKTKEVYIDVNNLPAPPQDKQYQLWAIVDGKPVDIGVFNTIDSLQKMKAVGTAQAFAVTLEKKGGSPTPTLEQMYVVGNIGS